MPLLSDVVLLHFFSSIVAVTPNGHFLDCATTFSERYEHGEEKKF